MSHFIPPMKVIFSFLAILYFLLSTSLVLAQTNPKHTYIKGYTRKDGTYVQGHYRTVRNSTNRDNFSTKGNYNPYTGQAGWVQPDNKPNPTYSYPSSNTSSYGSTSSRSNTAKYAGTTNSLGQKVITYTNGKEVFQLCNGCNNISYNKDLEYYWYTPDKGIQSSQGGAIGTLLDGEYKFYSKDGKLLVKANYRKGVEHGDYTIWNEQGNILEKMHFTAGEMDYTKFTNDDGYIIEWKGLIFKEGSVKNVYTSSGKLIESMKVGEDFLFDYKIYDETDGALTEEFTKGVGEYYHGTYKQYHKNGVKKFHGYFTDNFRNGTWTWYNSNGSVDTKLEYRIYTEKHENGKLKLKGSQYYDSDAGKWIREGRWIFFKPNGEDWADLKHYKDGIETTPKRD